MKRRYWFSAPLKIFLFLIGFSFFLIFVSIFSSGNLETEPSKYAYVFHVRTARDLCYALANGERVLGSMPGLDIVLLIANKTDTDKIRLPPRVTIHATPDINEMYHETFLKFEAFGLMNYDRVVVLNSNSVVTRKLNELFFIDLDGRDVAAAVANHPRAYFNLSAALIVAKPSQELYERFASYQSPNAVQEVADEIGLEPIDDSTMSKTLYEDALFNKMFRDGADLKLLPPYAQILGISARDLELYKEDLGVFCLFYTNAPSE